MKRIYVGILLILVISISVNGHCGVTITNGSLDKANLGDKEAVPKALVDAGLDRVDARPRKQIWVDDPGVAAVLGPPALTDLSDAIKAIRSTSTNLRISRGTFNVNGNLTIPSGITLLPERGVTLSIATGVTLTINGDFQAGLYQVFSCAGTGKIVFGAGSVKEVYPEWWGAKPDNNTDCTTAIQAALDAYNVCCLSAGHYRISSALTIRGIPSIYTGKKLYGQGRFITYIVQTTAFAKIINNTAQLNFSHCSLDYSITPTSGATAIYSTGGHSTFTDFHISKCDFGLEITTGSAQRASGYAIYGYNIIGVYVHDAIDFYSNQFVINAKYENTSGDNKLLGRLGGIRLYNTVESAVFTDGDVIGGLYSLNTNADTYVFRAHPSYCNFTNVFFDSAVRGASIYRIHLTEFVGCWFAGGREPHQPAADGAIIQQTDGLKFTNCRFYGNGRHGAYLHGQAIRTSFVNCSFESNSVISSSGMAHGLYVAPNTNDFSVVGCTAHNGEWSVGKQGYGVFVDTGTSNRYIITGNNLYGNVTGGLRDGGAGVDKIVRDNLGYVSRNSGVSYIASGQTNVVVNHGLAATPSVAGIAITPTTLWPNGRPYLDTTSINATSFTIRCATTGANEYFTWDARSPGDK